MIADDKTSREIADQSSISRCAPSNVIGQNICDKLESTTAAHALMKFALANKEQLHNGSQYREQN